MGCPVILFIHENAEFNKIDVVDDTEADMQQIANKMYSSSSSK